MESIATVVGVQLEHILPEGALQTYQWREFKDGAGQCTGAMKVVLATPAEVRALISQIRGTSVEVGGEVKFVELENLNNSTATIQTNRLAETTTPIPTDARASGRRGNGAGGRGHKAPLAPPPTPTLGLAA